MRNSFAKQITEIADKDESIRLLVGDIGFRIFDKYIENHSSSFINCGIAEQNMVGCAAGMASEGLKVFVYTITPFLTMRAYEQIRVDVGINRSNIILVGVGAGLAYDKLGPTHHSYEDLALMRSIPNQKIYTPYDGPSTAEATTLAYEGLSTHASYIRLSKGGEPEMVNGIKASPQIDKWSTTSSPEFVVITHGSLVNCFLPLSDYSHKYDVLALKELSSQTSNALIDLLQSYKKTCKNIIFCEESFEVGSFSSSFISKHYSKLFDFNIKQKFLPHEYVYDALDRDTILKQLGFTPNTLRSYFTK